MDHDQLKEIVPLEALDRLDGEEARALAAHLAEGCDECQAELLSYREALAAMAVSTAGAGPADRIWQRLESRLAAGEIEATPSRDGVVTDRPADRAARARAVAGVSRGWRVTALAASAAALALAVMMGNYANQIAATRAEDSARIATLDRQAQGLASELEDRNRDLAALRDQIALSG
jgi:hypothetical protein